MTETCDICGCIIHGKREEKEIYGTSDKGGRSYKSQHHYVPKRFLSRVEPVFQKCPWELENPIGKFCFDCHEQLLHNPLFHPDDISRLNKLVKLRNLNEKDKPSDKEKLANRVLLLHEVIDRGLKSLLGESQ